MWAIWLNINSSLKCQLETQLDDQFNVSSRFYCKLKCHSNKFDQICKDI